MNTGPFSLAFDHYWNWGIIGQIFESRSVTLPQLAILDASFPDAEDIVVYDFGSWVSFKAAQFEPYGASLSVHLASPSISSLVTGWQLRIIATRWKSHKPDWRCCGLYPAHQGWANEFTVTVPASNIVTVEQVEAAWKSKY